MSRNYNIMSFDVDEPNGKQNAFKFIQHLIELNLDNNRMYNDIKISQEETFIVVEWAQVPYSGEYGGKFKFVDDDQDIFTEKFLPDNTGVWVRDEEEYQELLDEYKKEHENKNTQTNEDEDVFNYFNYGMTQGVNE